MPIVPLHALQVRPDSILFLDALLWVQDGDLVVAGVCLHPSSVFLGPLGQGCFGDRILAVHITEEMHDMLRARQHRQVSLDDDAVETVIYKNQEAFKELREGFHRSPPQRVWLVTKIICPGGRWDQIQPAGVEAFFASWRLGEK